MAILPLTATSPWEAAPPTLPLAAGQCGGSFNRKLQNLAHTITLALRNDAAGAGRTLLDLRQSGRKSAHEGLLLRYCSGINKFDSIAMKATGLSAFPAVLQGSRHYFGPEDHEELRQPIGMRRPCRGAYKLPIHMCLID